MGYPYTNHCICMAESIYKEYLPSPSQKSTAYFQLFMQLLRLRSRHNFLDELNFGLYKEIFGKLYNSDISDFQVVFLFHNLNSWFFL